MGLVQITRMPMALDCVWPAEFAGMDGTGAETTVRTALIPQSSSVSRRLADCFPSLVSNLMRQQVSSVGHSTQDNW